MNSRSETRESQRRGVLVGLIVLSLLPLPFFVAWPNWSLPSTVWLYVAALAGYVGIVFLLWMYILGAKSVMGLYFDDLAPIRRIHKWLGTYGTVLLFVHPIAITLSYGYSLLTYSLLPRLDDSFERSVTWGRFALYALVIVWITSALLRSRMAFRPWKYMHYLAYLALPLALLHIPAIGSSYGRLDAPRVYFMSVLLLLVLVTILRLRHLFLLGRCTYLVRRQAEVSPGVWMLTLRPQGRRITPRSGQYVYLQWSLLGEEHPFSVLQVDETNGELTIAYKVSGAWTNKLASLEEESVVFVDGPYGTFLDRVSANEVAEPTVCIAAGIGITPFVEMLLRSTASNQWLFYANQRPETATFAKQLHRRLGDRYISIMSHADTPARANDERGRLTDETLTRYLGSDLQEHRFFICGNEDFMQSTREILTTLGVPTAHIRTEAFGW